MLFDWSLIMFGTATDPLKGNPHVPVMTPVTMPITTPPQDTTVTPGQESDKNSALTGKAIIILYIWRIWRQDRKLEFAFTSSKRPCQ